MSADFEADLNMSGTRSKKRKTLTSAPSVKSESTTDVSSITSLIEEESSSMISVKKSRGSKDSRDVNDDTNTSISSSSSSSSSSIERVYVIDESKPSTAVEIAVAPTGTSRPMSIESKMRRQALKNKTLKCSACTLGNDAEHIHHVLSIPICGNCNKNVLDDTFGRAENGQELRCTWCGDGE
jgi:hypothetical protein